MAEILKPTVKVKYVGADPAWIQIAIASRVLAQPGDEFEVSREWRDRQAREWQEIMVEVEETERTQGGGEPIE